LGGYTEVVEYLLQKGASSEAVGRGGVTARSLAEQGSYTAVVRLLDERKKTPAADGKVVPEAVKAPAGSDKKP